MQPNGTKQTRMINITYHPRSFHHDGWGFVSIYINARGCPEGFMSEGVLSGWSYVLDSLLTNANIY